MFVKEVLARKIKDSRGEYTIEVSINGQIASSPSGKSTGKYETPSFHKSLDWNINAINTLKEIKDLEFDSFFDLKKLESLIKKKFKFKDAKQFGANSLFALECAVLKALAKSEGKELWQIIPGKKNIPTPVGNSIGGGLHSKNKDHPSFQEFLLIPKAKNFKENYSLMNNVYSSLKIKLKNPSVNDEGALTTSLNEEEILELLHKYKEKVDIGVDVAANSFFCNNCYCYKNKCLDKNSQIHFINSLINKFNIKYVEDPLTEEDFSGFSKIIKKNLVVGDDLTVTHLSRLKKAVKNKSINAIIIKPNQNGSLIELYEIFSFCKKNKIRTILSHRSGETLDNALADLAVGFGSDYIKCGIATKYRKIKLDRLLDIYNFSK